MLLPLTLTLEAYFHSSYTQEGLGKLKYHSSQFLLINVIKNTEFLNCTLKHTELSSRSWSCEFSSLSIQKMPTMECKCSQHQVYQPNQTYFMLEKGQLYFLIKIILLMCALHDISNSSV